MPLIAGFVGWGTNVLALEMTFRPIRFVGPELFRIKDQPWGLFGWQGIIPTKAEKMASICFDLMTTKLLDIQEIFNRLRPEKFSEAMEEGVLLLMDEIVNEVAMEYMPGVWKKLPEDVRDEMVIVAHQASPEFLTAFMTDMQKHVDDILDMKQMTVQACVKNKHLMNKIFKECGDKEFTFIRRSGAYFGFAFGCVQMLIWFFYTGAWILPVAGFLVGWCTNWLALKVIFRPLYPVRVGCWTIQGLFLIRQMEVSETFARVNCVEILHAEAVWESILTGPLRKNFFAMLRAHSIVFTERLIGGLKPVAVASMGGQRFAEMKEDIATKICEKLPTIIDQSYEYMTEALDMENTIREKMKALTPEEFEGVLHPAFEEDEITLIAVGAILGLIVGVLQLFTLFAGQSGCPTT
mmetsp:Transcript_15232/g.30763  ORF Transcript_15232/g.30763 Transcript_15232/m.30763 type:complete len:408 (+) Transcript_15232:465-1688(+)